MLSLALNSISMTASIRRIRNLFFLVPTNSVDTVALCEVDNDYLL